jgi:hypothetical protein
MKLPFPSSSVVRPSGEHYLTAPEWVAPMLPGATSRCVERMSHLSVVVRESVEFCLVTACLADARHLSADQFHHSTAEIYRLIERELRLRTACYPVRIWNHLPDIHASGADGADRYMAFNAGRYQAYSQWLGGAGQLENLLGARASSPAFSHRKAGEDARAPRKFSGSRLFEDSAIGVRLAQR